MRLKRVFGKLSKASQGAHKISNTPENARDLEWFVTRYPLDIKEPEKLRAAADTHREREQAVRQLLAGSLNGHAFELAVPARDYQKIAASLALHRRGLLLADDVGLGKTASAICAMTEAEARPVVVVTLTHLPRQWRAELLKFAPSLNVYVAKTGKPSELFRKESDGQLMLLRRVPDVIVINYHKLVNWAETLGEFARFVVFDEVQELRRSESAKFSAAKHLAEKASIRMGLSATPIYNYGGEMFNVLSCIFPNQIGTRQEFATEWTGGWVDEKAKISEPKAFASYLRTEGLMLRRTRADVGRELPPIQVIPHFVDSDPAALDAIKGSCTELAKLILAQGETERGAKMRAAEELSNALRQATGIAKAPYVAEFARLLMESGESVVLYGWHRAVYDLWAKILEEHKPAFYTGTESEPQKAKAKADFIEGRTNLLVISLRSGAGLDGLQSRCRVVVFGELDWSPGVHEQCIGRVARDGQADSVAAYYLISEEGSDPVVSQVLGLKRQQIEGIRSDPNQEGDLIEKLQTDGSHIRKLAEGYLGKAGVAK